MSDLFIYLSGSIKKGKGDLRESFWDSEDISILKGTLEQYNVVFLNPATRTDDLSDFQSTFGRDMFQVFSSDIVIVDARDRRGIGVGAEMVYAKLNRTPIVTIAPPGTHYYRENFVFMEQHLKEWVHPFVFGLSDQIVSSVADAAEWIQAQCLPGRVQIKGVECFDSAMKHYLTSQKARDTIMMDLISKHKGLISKVNKIMPPE